MHGSAYPYGAGAGSMPVPAHPMNTPPLQRYGMPQGCALQRSTEMDKLHVVCQARLESNAHIASGPDGCSPKDKYLRANLGSRTDAPPPRSPFNTPFTHRSGAP